ncbi:MAG: DUF2157 domain-containing protein [Bacteroidota bacterium]
MDSARLADKLHGENLIDEASHQKIIAADSSRLFSLNFELKSLLYAGVLLLTGGLGIAIYKNIDSIGHLAVILLIALISAACFTWCIMKKNPYSNEKVTSPNIFYDYVLLFGCLTTLSFTGYLQYQYSVFGPFNGLAFIIPAILFLISAYKFDHIGVLSIGITCLAAFLGISITPTSLISENDFSSDRLIFTGLFFGAVLVVAGRFFSQQNIKKHFTFTYYNFAMHLLFISCLAGLFSFGTVILFVPILGIIIYICIRHSMKERSFYFLLVAAIYGYIGVSYLFFYLLSSTLGMSILYIVPLYLIGSAVMMIRYLKKYWKKIKGNADLQ